MTTWNEIVDGVRQASEKEGLRVQGNGTLVQGDFAGKVLRVGGYEGIEEYDRSERLLVIKSGTKISKIREVLQGGGQRLAFDPPDYSMVFGNNGQENSGKSGGATIGGVVAANLNGGGGLFWGTARDHVLGMRVCSGTGEIYKAGGRTVKNVSGFDITKMMVGSKGRLGVILELNLKVIPLADEEVTLCYEEENIAVAAKLARVLMRTPFGVVKATYREDVLYVSLEGGGLTETIKRLPRKPDTVWESNKNTIFWNNIRDGIDLFNALENYDNFEIWQVLTSQTTGALFLDKFLKKFPDGKGYFEWSGARVWTAFPANNMATFKQFVTGMQAEVSEKIALKPFKTTRENHQIFRKSNQQEDAMWKRLKQIHDPKEIFENKP